MADDYEKEFFPDERLWGEHPLPDEKPTIKDFGSMWIWSKTLNGDFWIACIRKSGDESIDAQGGKPPEDKDWSRWAISENFDRIRFSPTFPDRPVVVVPESSFILKPRSQARIFVRCPLWVKIELLNQSSFTVTNMPIAMLSNTWFGSFTQGEICYWISSSAKRRPSLDPKISFLAICPIDIKNSSPEELAVEKVCLRVGCLSLYDRDGQLWSDEMGISFRGKDNISALKASGKPPAEAPKATLVASPYDPIKKGFAAKTFYPLRGLPGFGFLET